MDNKTPSADMPSREELEAELLDIPEEVEESKRPELPGLEQLLNQAVSYVKAKRGGDLVAVILVGSGTRRSLTPHSDLDLIALIKGQDEGHEIVRISDRLIDIRYRGHQAVEQELVEAPRLPPLLRKGRVLFEHESIGTLLLEKAHQRFRQGPPPATLNEKIRMKTDCLHWLGKAEDLVGQPATAQYLLGIFLEDLLQACFRIRRLWLTSPADMLRFISSRDRAVGELLDRFIMETNLQARVGLARQLVDLVFKDIPNPPRVD